MEDNREKDPQIEEQFMTKLAELLEIAKKKKNVIEDSELISHFAGCKGLELDVERMNAILDYLEAHNVDVLTITDKDDEEPDDVLLEMDDEVEDIDVDKIDLSVPDGVGFRSLS